QPVTRLVGGLSWAIVFPSLILLLYKCRRQKPDPSEIFSIFSITLLFVAPFMGVNREKLVSFIESQKWLPYMNCELLKTGEPDIIGPGVSLTSTRFLTYS